MERLNYLINSEINAGEVFRRFEHLIDQLSEQSIERDVASSHFYSFSKQEVLNRADYYITKEIRDLQRLERNGEMTSQLDILNEDIFGNEGASALFTLRNENPGHSRFEYAVYLTPAGYLTPKFSVQEILAYQLGKFRKR